MTNSDQPPQPVPTQKVPVGEVCPHCQVADGGFHTPGCPLAQIPIVAAVDLAGPPEQPVSGLHVNGTAPPDGPRWSWLLIFQDGSVLAERQPDGSTSQWPTDRIPDAMALVLSPADPRHPAITVSRDQDAQGRPTGRYVTFYRRTQMDLTTGERRVIHIAGLESEYSKGSYVFGFDDGSALLSDNLNAV